MPCRPDRRSRPGRDVAKFILPKAGAPPLTADRRLSLFLCIIPFNNKELLGKLMLKWVDNANSFVILEKVKNDDKS
jgi:hypothetical protein